MLCTRQLFYGIQLSCNVVIEPTAVLQLRYDIKASTLISCKLTYNINTSFKSAFT